MNLSTASYIVRKFPVDLDICEGVEGGRNIITSSNILIDNFYDLIICTPGVMYALVHLQVKGEVKHTSSNTNWETADCFVTNVTSHLLGVQK